MTCTTRSHRWFADSEVEKDPLIPSLSRKQRLLAFVGFATLSIFCLSLVSTFLEISVTSTCVGHMRNCLTMMVTPVVADDGTVHRTESTKVLATLFYGKCVRTCKVR